MRVRVGTGGATSVRRWGAAGAAALTFMLAASAINPVVVVATAVVIPSQPKIVIAMTPPDR